MFIYALQWMFLTFFCALKLLLLIESFVERKMGVFVSFNAFKV